MIIDVARSSEERSIKTQSSRLNYKSRIMNYCLINLKKNATVVSPLRLIKK